MKSAISQILPRLMGSVLITATFLGQTLPASAQPAATNSSSSAQSPAAAGQAPAATGPAAPTPPPAKAAAPAAPAAAVPPAAAATPTPTQPAAPDAPPPRDEEGAKAALAAGQEAYRNGDYATAAQHFTKANELAASATAQYWLAMALDLQGRAADAVVAFETLFASPDHQQLGEDLLDPARKRFELLKKIPATVLLQVTPTDAIVEVDGVQQQGAAPFTLKLSAGKHALKVSKEGFEPLETELEVAAAASVEQAVELVAAPIAPPPVAAAPPAAAAPAPPPEPRSKVPAYVTLGVAGVSAVLGTVFGVQALGAKSDFDDNPTAKNADDVERNALISDMAWGIALTLGITGVVLLTSDEPAPAEQVSNKKRRRQVAGGDVLVAPYVTPSGGGAAARVTF